MSLRTTQGRFLGVPEPNNVEFSLSVDTIAQESNETFAIVLRVSSNPLGADATIVDRLEVVIIDSSGRLTIQ